MNIELTTHAKTDRCHLSIVPTNKLNEAIHKQHIIWQPSHNFVKKSFYFFCQFLSSSSFDPRTLPNNELNGNYYPIFQSSDPIVAIANRNIAPPIRRYFTPTKSRRLASFRGRLRRSQTIVDEANHDTVYHNIPKEPCVFGFASAPLVGLILGFSWIQQWVKGKTVFSPPFPVTRAILLRKATN